MAAIDLRTLKLELVNQRGQNPSDRTAAYKRAAGLVFIIELRAAPADEDALKQQLKIVEQALRHLFADDVHGVGAFVNVSYLFAKSLARRFDPKLGRFIQLRIRGNSFDDANFILGRTSRNSYDLGYALRDALNAYGAPAPILSLLVDSVLPDIPFDFTISCHEPPTGDFSQPYGWEIDAMGLPAAWDLAAGGYVRRYGEDIVVGHCDTGYSHHPALPMDRILVSEGDDVVDGNQDASDPLNTGIFNSEPGHGTSTATQIMSASAVNPIQPIEVNRVIGAAPRAKLVPIRVCDSTAFIFNSDVAQGIAWAIDEGCDIVSLSIGGGFTPGSEDIIQKAYDSNVIVIAAAGNCIPFVVFPAAFDRCLAVGASSENGTYWEHAPDSAKIAFAAPGDAVRTTLIKKDPLAYSYNWGSGTSFSTAFTSGVCALWLAYFGKANLLAAGLGPLQDLFTTFAKNTAVVPPGWDKTQHGAGILSAEALLNTSPLPQPVQAAGSSSVVNTTDTLMNSLRNAIATGTGSDPNMLAVAGKWFGKTLANDIRTMIRDFGGEMINLLIGITPDTKPVLHTLTDYFNFFKEKGSLALKSALAQGVGQ